MHHAWSSVVGLTLLDDADATAAEKKLSASLHTSNVQSVRQGIVQMNSARCWEQAEDSRISSDLMVSVSIYIDIGMKIALLCNYLYLFYFFLYISTYLVFHLYIAVFNLLLYALHITCQPWNLRSRDRWDEWKWDIFWNVHPIFSFAFGNIILWEEIWSSDLLRKYSTISNSICSVRGPISILLLQTWRGCTQYIHYVNGSYKKCVILRKLYNVGETNFINELTRITPNNSYLQR